jgi:hypothetical protein
MKQRAPPPARRRAHNIMAYIMFNFIMRKMSYAKFSVFLPVCTCWLPNREIYITGTAPCSTGTGYSTSTVR